MRSARARLPACPTRPSSGVTLLEILVVLALLALVGSIVAPTIGSGPGTAEMKSAARQIASGLRLARSHAVAEQREAALVVDLEERRFKVDNDPREIRMARGLELKLYTAQSDVVSDRIGLIRFYPDGGSNGGRVSVIAGARRLEVDVDWLTGRIAITD